MADVYLDEAMKILEEWQKQSGSIASIGVVEWNASDDGRQLRKLIAAALRDAAKREREECAKLAEEFHKGEDICTKTRVGSWGSRIAAAIRARA